MYKLFSYIDEQEANIPHFAPRHLLVNMDLVSYIDFSVSGNQEQRLEGFTLHFNSGEIKCIPANTDLNKFEYLVSDTVTTIIRCYK